MVICDIWYRKNGNRDTLMVNINDILFQKIGKKNFIQYKFNEIIIIIMINFT